MPQTPLSPPSATTSDASSPGSASSCAQSYALHWPSSLANISSIRLVSGRLRYPYSEAQRWATRGSDELVEQRLRLFKIRGVEAFSEPAIDGAEKVAGLGMAAMVTAQPGEAHGGAQFVAPCALLAGDREGGAERVLGLRRIGVRQPTGELAAQAMNFCVPALRAADGRFCQCVVQSGERFLYIPGKRQRLGQQGEKQRCGGAVAGRLVRGQTVADAGNSRRRFTPLGIGPALENPAPGRPVGETVFTRDRHAIVAAGVDGGDISSEDRGPAGQAKSVGKGVGMSQFPAVRERTFRGSGGLIRMAAMPKRPRQDGKGADPDVLPVVKGGIAVLVGPIQRRGGFGMLGGRTVVAAKDQRISEGSMADQERAGRGLRLREGQEVSGVFERGRNIPSI